MTTEARSENAYLGEVLAEQAQVQQELQRRRAPAPAAPPGGTPFTRYKKGLRGTEEEFDLHADE